MDQIDATSACRTGAVKATLFTASVVITVASTDFGLKGDTATGATRENSYYRVFRLQHFGCAGINRQEEEDESALHRRSSDPR